MTMQRIFIIEDDFDLATSIRLGINLIERPVLKQEMEFDGAAALVRVQNPPVPDLILLDLNLPRKNGREVLAEIKGDPRFKSIPVVILTTSHSEKDVLQAYDLHANCYIVKPVGFENFVEAVKTIRQFWFSVVTLPPEETHGQDSNQSSAG